MSARGTGVVTAVAFVSEAGAPVVVGDVGIPGKVAACCQKTIFYC